MSNNQAHNAKFYKRFVQVGLNIMRYRKENGYSQEQLAEMTGYSRHQIQRVEAATATPSLAMLYEISDALNVPLEKLLRLDN